MVNLYGVVWSYSTCIRVTANSGTIIDHIYVNKEENVSRVSVSKIRISDHHVIFCNKKINSCFKKNHTSSLHTDHLSILMKTTF